MDYYYTNLVIIPNQHAFYLTKNPCPNDFNSKTSQEHLAYNLNLNLNLNQFKFKFKFKFKYFKRFKFKFKFKFIVKSS